MDEMFNIGRMATSTKKKTSTRRTRRSTLSPSIINHIIDNVVDVFENIANSLNNRDQNEARFLKEQGYNTEKYFSLLDKRRKIEQDTPMILHEVISDINTLHENRKDFYIVKSKYFLNQLAEIKKNSSVYAINEIKRFHKDIYTVSKIKYGFFKARRHTRKLLTEIDLETKFKDLVDDNIKKSNYDMIEQMIQELRKEYMLEVYFFQRCLNKLYKKYKGMYPKEFQDHTNMALLSSIDDMHVHDIKNK